MPQERPALPYQIAKTALLLLMTDDRKADDPDTYMFAVAACD
jgi:hypothetical protein